MDHITQLIYQFAAAIPILLTFGFGWKWLPGLRNLANEGILPLLNALVAFVTAFGGGATVAHAGVFGDIGSIMLFGAKVGLSAIASLFAAKIHDVMIKPLTPPSPYKAK